MGVSQVRRVVDDCVYVMKTINIEGMTPKEQADAINEVRGGGSLRGDGWTCGRFTRASLTHPRCRVCVQVRIMASLDHPNVVRYYDSFLEKNMLNIVMEYCEEGDLQMFLKKCAQRRVFPPEDIIWRFFLQIAVALHYLHGRRILHRDIKSANIFVGKVCASAGGCLCDLWQRVTASPTTAAAAVLGDACDAIRCAL